MEDDAMADVIVALMADDVIANAVLELVI